MNKREPRKSIIANFGALLTQNTAAPGAGDSAAEATKQSQRVGAGVIGATQRTLSDIRDERDRLRAQLEAGAGLELDPGIIEPSPFPDRLPDDSELEYETFKKQIEEEGQKIPIQVRRHPDVPGRYQIVYGHRRWRAAKDLGRSVKSIVVNYSDSELVVAQGIENAARQDLTWIERALFAWRMDQAGIKARDIRASLGIDDPELARFRSVCRALPEEVLRAIGRAPKIGRPRWVALAGAVAVDPGALVKIQETLAADKVFSRPSDERFSSVLRALKDAPKPQPVDLAMVTPTGKAIGNAKFSRSDIRLSIAPEHAQAFGDYLREEMPKIVQRYLARIDDP